MIEKLKVEEKQKELKEWLKKIDVSQLNFAERVYYHMYDNDNSEEIKRFKEKFKKDIRRSTTDIKLLESYLEILYNQEEFLKLGHTKTVFLFRNDFDDEFNGKLKVLYNLLDKFTLYSGDIIEENKGIYGDVILSVLNENSKKSYLILQEITCLIHSQFPDAAYARWRSLHELLVVSLFIKKHGEKCAETYLKSIKSQQKHMFEVYVKSQDKFLENEKFTNDEIEKMDENLSEIENKFYGYNWANSCLKKPIFANIEKDVGLEHLRYFYKLSSMLQHGNMNFVFNNIALTVSHPTITFYDQIHVFLLKQIEVLEQKQEENYKQIIMNKIEPLTKLKIVREEIIELTSDMAKDLENKYMTKEF